jgi:cytochrome P450
MTIYPEVMKKAQAEIDAVVGNDRLPTFADREHLPYINALAKEVLRWNAVVPFGEHASPFPQHTGLTLSCPRHTASFNTG